VSFCSASAFASSSVTPDPDETTQKLPVPELPSPALDIRAADTALVDGAAELSLPGTELAAEKLTAPVPDSPVELSDDADALGDDETLDEAVKSPPETALRLPGVAEEDHPHFRRQMYRTDI